MQSSDPAIYAAGDSASCSWAAGESSHWFQMRLWSQVSAAAGRASCYMAAEVVVPLLVCLWVSALDSAGCPTLLPAPPPCPQARSMGIYAAHCMAGVQEQASSSAPPHMHVPATQPAW